MSNEIQKSSPIETNADTVEPPYWITNEDGEMVLSSEAIERAWREILREDEERGKFRKKEDPYGDEMSLRKKPEDLIKPLDKLGGKLEKLDARRFPDSDRPYPYNDVYGVDFELIKQRLVGLKKNEFKIMMKLLDILNSIIPKENPVAPSTDQQHPKTNFQSPTIPSASFKDRKLK